MEPSELLKHLSSTLDRLGIPYLITGSTASITYGEPRFTNVRAPLCSLHRFPLFKRRSDTGTSGTP
jgi:hypothetical protein